MRDPSTTLVVRNGFDGLNLVAYEVKAKAPGLGDYYGLFFQSGRALRRLPNSGVVFPMLSLIGEWVSYCDDPKKQDKFRRSVCPNSFKVSDILPEALDDFGVSPSRFYHMVNDLVKVGIVCPVKSLIDCGLDGKQYNQMYPHAVQGTYMTNPFVLARGDIAGVTYARGLWMQCVVGNTQDATAKKVADAAAKLNNDAKVWEKTLADARHSVALQVAEEAAKIAKEHKPEPSEDAELLFDEQNGDEYVDPPADA